MIMTQNNHNRKQRKETSNPKTKKKKKRKKQKKKKQEGHPLPSMTCLLRRDRTTPAMKPLRKELLPPAAGAPGPSPRAAMSKVRVWRTRKDQKDNNCFQRQRWCYGRPVTPVRGFVAIFSIVIAASL